ncbi:MAG TPA: hypothetical protein VMZ66_13500 [Aeromicrobium sp.]|nr:hypothetical protein [Aeromicrobium sp.]
MKAKVSATVNPERLAKAKALTGCDNVSEVLDRGLAALIEMEQERLHAAGYERQPQGEDTIEAVDSEVWSDLPWDEE